jgi:carbon monoxide dehydrogenase subunit G
MGNWTVTNLLAAGAHERTPKRVQLLLDGATGFSEAGDSMCWKVKVGFGVWSGVLWVRTEGAGLSEEQSSMRRCRFG